MKLYRQLLRNVSGAERSFVCIVLLPMERFFLSILCASTALLVAAFVATNPIAVADNQSPQVPVLRLVQR